MMEWTVHSRIVLRIAMDKEYVLGLMTRWHSVNVMLVTQAKHVKLDNV